MKKKYEEMEKLKAEKNILIDELDKLNKILRDEKEQKLELIENIFNRFDKYETKNALDSILNLKIYWSDSFERGHKYYKTYKEICEYIKTMNRPEKDYTNEDIHNLGHLLFNEPKKFNIYDIYIIRAGKESLTDYFKDKKSLEQFNYKLKETYDLEVPFIIAAICFEFDKLNLFETYELKSKYDKINLAIHHKEREIKLHQSEINQGILDGIDESIEPCLQKLENGIDRVISSGVKFLIKKISNSNDDNK